MLNNVWKVFIHEKKKLQSFKAIKTVAAGQ